MKLVSEEDGGDVWLAIYVYTMHLILLNCDYKTAIKWLSTASSHL